MENRFTPLAYGRKNGTIISEEQFFKEHQDIALTSGQIKQLKDNLKVQALLFLQEYRDITSFTVNSYLQTFAFIEEETNEMYFMPLYKANIKVFFDNFTTTVLIYDMRK